MTVISRFVATQIRIAVNPLDKITIFCASLPRKLQIQIQLTSRSEKVLQVEPALAMLCFYARFTILRLAILFKCQ